MNKAEIQTVYDDIFRLPDGKKKKETRVFLAFNGYNITVNFNDTGYVNVDRIRLAYERVSSPPCDHRN